MLTKNHIKLLSTLVLSSMCFAYKGVVILLLLTQRVMSMTNVDEDKVIRNSQGAPTSLSTDIYYHIRQTSRHHQVITMQQTSSQGHTLIFNDKPGLTISNVFQIVPAEENWYYIQSIKTRQILIFDASGGVFFVDRIRDDQAKFTLIPHGAEAFFLQNKVDKHYLYRPALITYGKFHCPHHLNSSFSFTPLTDESMKILKLPEELDKERQKSQELGADLSRRKEEIKSLKAKLEGAMERISGLTVESSSLRSKLDEATRERSSRDADDGATEVPSESAAGTHFGENESTPSNWGLSDGEED